MTPQALKALRLDLGLSANEFALMLGFKGKKATRQVMIYQFEAGIKPIPATMEMRLAWLEKNRVRS